MNRVSPATRLQITHLTLTIVKEAVRLNGQRLQTNRKALWLETIANVLFVATTLIFWEVIYSTFPNNQIGLSKQELYVYLAFVEMFYGLKGALFPVTSKLWRVIYNGQMVAMMIRPIHPILLFLLNNLRLEQLIPPLPIIIFLLMQGREVWSWNMLMAGMAVLLIGVILAALLELTASLLSFWITKMNALDEVMDSFMNFTKYPLTIFHYGWQIVFTVVFPFMFYATIPSFIAMLGKEVSLLPIMLGFILVVAWIILLSMLWKKGLQRYDGFSG